MTTDNSNDYKSTLTNFEQLMRVFSFNKTEDNKEIYQRVDNLEKEDRIITVTPDRFGRDLYHVEIKVHRRRKNARMFDSLETMNLNDLFITLDMIYNDAKYIYLEGVRVKIN